MNRPTLAIFLLSLHAAHASYTQLGTMMSLVLRRPPTDYLNYGNWCGVGGDGTVMDAIDACCRSHDMCYAQRTHQSCPKASSSKQRPAAAEYNGDLVLSPGVFMVHYAWGVEKAEEGDSDPMAQIVCGVWRAGASPAADE